MKIVKEDIRISIWEIPSVKMAAFETAIRLQFPGVVIDYINRNAVMCYIPWSIGVEPAEAKLKELIETFEKEE